MIDLTGTAARLFARERSFLGDSDVQEWLERKGKCCRKI
jgi:hypothetical protein